ncbi:glycosyltransferase [Nocardia sp. NPDC059691]|uniref:glycosyltransferase n=1 Tax=Nocardia sp. NPDC059691 TaxID=3346908 RepID=UPI0036C5EE56
MTVFLYWSGQEFDFGNYLAVASAAVHTSGDVVVLVDERPVNNPFFDRLLDISNVEVRPLRLDSLMSGRHAQLYESMQFVAHRSDLVGFAALAEYGGIVLDTDTLTVRDLDDLPDVLLFEDEKIVYLGVVGLPRAHPISVNMLDSLLAMPEKDLGVYQSIVYRWTDVVRAEAPAMTPLSKVFPLHWREWERIFLPDGYQADTEPIHILHHYGYYSRKYTKEMNEDWLRENPCLFSALALPVLDKLSR